MLDTIEQNAEKSFGLAKKISVLRTDYRIIDSIDNFELLAALRTHRDAVVLSAPCSSWATSKTEAFAILEQVMEYADKLKAQRNQLLETCEETVFTLDYADILNRFKAEYTNFFKIFKSSYKEDTKKIRLVFKEVRKKIPDDEIIALLHALRQYNEDLREYQMLSSQIAKLFDIQEYDIHNLQSEKRITLSLSDAAMEVLRVKAVGNLDNGGRGIGNIVESLLINPLSRYLFDNEIFEDRIVVIEDINADTQPYSLVCTVS